MTDKLKPWQAQAKFVQSAELVKAPFALKIEAQQSSCTISWRKSPGVIDGFIILLGQQSDMLRQHERVTVEESPQSKIVEGLSEGVIYYISVVAYKDNKISDIPEIWKVKPGFFGSAGLESFSGRINLNAPSDQVVRKKLFDMPSDNKTAVTKSTGVKRKKLFETGEDKKRKEFFGESEPISVEKPVRKKLFDGDGITANESEAPAEVGNTHRKQLFTESEPDAICNNCNNGVFLDRGKKVYVCSGCRKEFVTRPSDNRFIAVDALPDGICNCCNPKHPIIASAADLKKCSRSGMKYVDLPGRGMIPVHELDYGLCECCAPQNPLKLNMSGQVVCSRQADKLYVRESPDEPYHVKEPEAPQSLVEEIDDALRNGSAMMMPGGIMGVDRNSGNSGSPARGRRSNF